jgi:cyclopropane fatty-acyl-phospholipid synthase-like methyltransferase
MGSPDALKASYDETPYNDQSFREFDLSRLLGMAQLFGLAPTDCSDLRVLDLGCASGVHIREQALQYPDVRFTGIDFAAAEIELGRKAIAEAGLENVELIAADLRSVEIESGAFDIVLCHGIFSWVPDDVKERIFLLARQALKPKGMAAIAYLTYPGWKQREAIRELLAMRVHDIKAPEQRIKESAQTLRFLHAGYSAHSDNCHAQGLKAIVEDMQQTASNVFLHDELGREHDPCYFLQFAEWAAECGLAYLAETDLDAMSLDRLDPSARASLQALAPDFLQTQQLIDFVVNRSGRSSLLVRNDWSIDRTIAKASLECLSFSTQWWNVTPLNAADGTPARFESSQGVGIQIDDPAVRDLVVRLARAAPSPVSYEEILTWGRETDRSPGDVADILMQLMASGLAEPRFTLS